MMPLLTPAQMYALEKAHFDAGMPTLVAMENASAAFIDELNRFAGPLAEKRIVVACGSGNNGGDGYAAARIAHGLGAEVSLLPMTPIEALRGDASVNALRAVHELHLPIVHCEELASLKRPDIWIDALFGIGLSRAMPEALRPLIERMESDRASGSIIASVDVPSGLNAESGRIEQFAVHADLTVTFQYAKTGHYLLDGMDCTGKLVVRGIGMDRFPPAGSARLIEAQDPSAAFPHRKHNSHKGTYGHLLVVAGSFGMTGAAMYTAHAALRAGAGLVSIACPQSIVPILQTVLPAAMCIPLPEQDGAVSSAALPIIKEALRGKTAAAAGPGLSTRAAPSIIEEVLSCGLPAIVDADALNIISCHEHLKKLLRPHHIITPHPGEARRLCPGCTGNPLADAELLRALNAVVLLKGAATVIRSGQTFISASGSPGMAAGGSGDVLSGVLGALLASGVSPETAAWSASELHGRCGELAERHINPVSMNAGDLIEHLPCAIGELYR